MAASRSAARRAGQVITGFGSLVVLCAVLVGAPIALVALAGNPLPAELPTLDSIGTALTSRDDGQLFLRALAVLGWFGWATFAFSVLVELVAQVLRRPTPKLPGMRNQQRAAAALVGSVALIIAASPAATAATAVYGSTYAAPASIGSAPAALSGPAPMTMAAQSSTGQAPTTPVARGVAAPVDQTHVYRVAKGDYLGEVAERYLEDFQSYRVLVKLNKLGDPDRIHPGQLLKLPQQADDGGVRPHATGRLVDRPSPRPTPPPAAPAPDEIAPDGTAPDQGAPEQIVPERGTPDRTTEPPTTDWPQEEAPPMTVGAARPGPEDRVNRPLAVSAVLAVASIVGAQIGAVLGLRRRPTPSGGGTRALTSGRHRR
ncbi:LysM peptidoglycan-binding domain-containing protein [Micromonospora cathayae]|uniref:LysM peptidoglycan-binding domain-containing protein n=1 Tax=Micromonospora cathayae TaxID=3028804 RepID=A0ABY7ZWE0_9ACTN|nr:LysM peptidoglycan-binding domain-containing protein [Micromonospora sp. HUAS 3]WDZ86219.1 LysM peptidoglycan-binding domain-containing protein [Micromonospora sp. HUAS 3]